MGVIARMRRWFQRKPVDRDTQREAEAIAEQRDNTRGWYGGVPTSRPLDTQDRPPR